MTATLPVKWSSLAALACLLAVLAARAAPAPPPSLEGKPSPPFAGTALPEPPRQKLHWAPAKTTLPKVLLTATSALFQAGLADPRGCEYRVLEVGTGSCWSGDGGIVRTHGWLLPGRAGAKQRFAVCWNGLVYPVVLLLGPANLQADVRAVLAADEKARAKDRSAYRFRHAWAEPHSLSHTSLLPLKACLLLRLGEEELARGVWTAWTAGMRENTNDDSVHLRDPYLMLATDWAWARFDRALGAHMRRDDRLALLDARALTDIHKAIEAEADRRGFSKREDLKGEKQPHLSFLRQLPDLLADQERRARVRPVARAAAGADKARRIAGLIRDLENVSGRQWGQPGGVSLNMDGTVAALVEEGDAAVEPLLKCLEEDQRLTRSVQFHRDFFHHRSILGAHEAAYEALTGILEISVGYRDEDRQKLARKARAYWNKIKNVSREERWYLTLADDKAARELWMQAAENIVRRVAGSGRKKGERPLRKKKGPSVTELLVRRIDTMTRSRERSSTGAYQLHDACRMVDRLTTWDARAALPVLRNQTNVCRDYLAGKEGAFYNAHSMLGRDIARFTELRHQAGDRTALGEYAAWIKTIGPREAEHSVKELLAPLWEHPDHPALAAAAETMFTAPSPWTKQFVRGFHARDIVNTPLVGVPAFRNRLLIELADTSPASEAGAKSPYRVCDFYANRLSELEGAPQCELNWSLRERDRGVAASVVFLKKYGERFMHSPVARALAGPGSEVRARMVFPPLDRPATAKEARAWKAIFALEGASKVRACKLPALPIRAKWLTYKGAPYVRHGWDTARKRTFSSTEYDQDGVVWQAEEVWKDGKWVRYYGFVGRYVVAKVPAAEIEVVAAK